MPFRKLFEVQGIARSNYFWHENKTRINVALSLALLLLLVGAVTFL